VQKTHLGEKTDNIKFKGIRSIHQMATLALLVTLTMLDGIYEQKSKKGAAPEGFVVLAITITLEPYTMPHSVKVYASLQVCPCVIRRILCGREHNIVEQMCCFRSRIKPERGNRTRYGSASFTRMDVRSRLMTTAKRIRSLREFERSATAPTNTGSDTVMATSSMHHSLLSMAQSLPHVEREKVLE
jgi:hypothetical protein